jgi:Arc-like DNA binding domain
MNVDLFLKNVPSVVKELIGREAFENRRSVNQEAIALLEEALLHRVGQHHTRARTSLEALHHPAINGTAATGTSPQRESFDTGKETH